MCFNSNDLAGISEPMEVLAASLSSMAFFPAIVTARGSFQKVDQMGEMAGGNVLGGRKFVGQSIYGCHMQRRN